MILRMNLIYNVQSTTGVSVISVCALLFSLFGIYFTILDFYDLFILDVLYYARFFNNISCIACYLTGEPKCYESQAVK